MRTARSSRSRNLRSDRVPVSLGVLLDISDSMFGRRIADARVAVDRFLFEQLDHEDEFFILAFNHKPHVLTQWTQTPVVVREALDGIKPTGGTAVYDAVVASMPLIAKRNRERGALLIVSDGADTASNASLKEVQAALRRSQAFVYAIAIDSPDRRAINGAVNPTTLRDITNESGGRTEVVAEHDRDCRRGRCDCRRAESSIRHGLYAGSRRPTASFIRSACVRKTAPTKCSRAAGYVADIPKS